MIDLDLAWHCARGMQHSHGPEGDRNRLTDLVATSRPDRASLCWNVAGQCLDS